MSKKFRGVRLLGAPVLFAALAAPLAGGCGEDLDPTSCKADLEARVEALSAAADALVEVAGEMKVSVGTACVNLARAGGEEVADITKDSSDDDVKAACGKAEASISANLSAAGQISLTIEGGQCSVNASAQLNCEASCSVEGECDPGTVEARCEGGELSVSCEGECAGGATCEGTAELAANCEGSCAGTCEGECEGEWSSDEGGGSGKCEGTCKGTCTGNCELAANANVSCGAEVKCKGECNGTASLPECRATLEPPSCNLDADCQAGCEGQASLKAECTPPKVKFNFSGDVDANFVAALEANLPAFLQVVAQGELVVGAAVDVGDRFVGVAGAVVKVPGCLAKFGADITAKAQASVQASASVSVSVNASASASGSASSGG